MSAGAPSLDQLVAALAAAEDDVRVMHDEFRSALAGLGAARQRALRAELDLTDALAERGIVATPADRKART